MFESSTTPAQEFTVSGPDAAYGARRAFNEVALGWLDPGVYAEARLLLSELVSAVVMQHNEPAEIDVRLSPARGDGLRAEVSIPVSERQPPVRAFRLVAGHRAQILDALADGWGVVLTPGAPYVWFELGTS